MEKMTSHAFRAIWDGLFWLRTCLLTGQIWADQNFFDHFEFKIQNYLGSAIG